MKEPENIIEMKQVLEAALLTSPPVSYTHLDVYKRQMYNSALAKSVILL